ncbi:MAG: transporter substrate-binding domain-containing protein [Candidatus Babeliaceae bacterium]|jgi:polar amino acid transport system substrate-binding protein
MKKKIIILFFIVTSFVILFWFNYITQRTLPEIPSPIIVGTSADFKPFSFKENDKIVGLDIDIVNEVCRRLGQPLILKDMPFELLIPQLQLGTIHMVAAGLTATPARAERVLFAPPHLTGDQLVVVSLASNAPVTSLKDLEGKEVIVNQGYTADVYMSQFPGIKIRRLGTVSDAFLALSHGRGYAYVIASQAVKPFFEKNNITDYNVFILEEAAETVSLALCKEYPMLAQKVASIITDMVEDGTIQHYKEAWLSHD